MIAKTIIKAIDKLPYEEREKLFSYLQTQVEDMRNALNGDLPENELNSSNKALSSYPQRNKIYHDVDLPKDNASGKQELFNRDFNIDGNIQTLTLARNGGAKKIFEQQGIEIIESKNSIEATAEIKKMFDAYKRLFRKIWKLNDWFNIAIDDYSELFKLFGNQEALKGVPYVGYQNEKGEQKRFGTHTYIWLPITINGKFISLGSIEKNKKANFSVPNESEATLI